MKCHQVRRIGTTGAYAPPYLDVVAHYEKLIAWRESHNLALAVYRATQQFPADERYGLTSQMRRAAFSAAANIVEGCSRRGKREFRRFVDIALSSLTEVGYGLQFARDVGIMAEGDWTSLHDQQSRARFLTWRLYNSLRGS
jgi:four helix bundle protein